MNQARQNEIPDIEGNKFLSLGTLLETVSVATLATAIDECGIYTRDKFGRFGLANDSDKGRALRLLETHHEWEINSEEPASDPRSPMEQWGCVAENAYEHFGWIDKVAPDFVSIQKRQDGTVSSTDTKPKGHLNHDMQMQLRANEIAETIKKGRNRSATRDEVANELAMELGMNEETVKRRIRKQWK